MPLLNIHYTNTESRGPEGGEIESRVSFRCDLYFGTDPNTRTVSIETSAPVPASYIPDEEFFRMEVAAIVKSLVTVLRAKDQMRIIRNTHGAPLP